MLAFVTFPTAAIAHLTPEEIVAVMMVQAHSDLAGTSFAAQETLAAGTKMSTSRMQRALAGAAKAKAITVRKRFARTNISELAEQFRRKPPAPRPMPAAAAPIPAGDISEGESEKDSKNLKKEEAPVRRFAPPPRPVQGPNPFARALWLRKLNAFIGDRLSGSDRMLGWELVAKAEAGALIDRVERRQLDDIDRAMRACGVGLTCERSSKEIGR